MKKIYILNGVGCSGKDTFVTYLSKYVSIYKYSIVDLVKEVAKHLGWDGSKTEKDRKFLSDLVDLATKYNDIPYKDVASIVRDFKINLIEDEVLIIDMRDPKDISRAIVDFGAESILIRNPRVNDIKTNHADANVENFDYHYIINNDGTLEDLDQAAKEFYRNVICK